LWKARQADERANRRTYIDALLQITALLAGTALILLGHEWVGGFVAGAGLYRVAKEFVVQKFR
jgi:hypothetical protein